MEMRLQRLWESIKHALVVLGFPAFQIPRLIRLRLQLEELNAEIARLSIIQNQESHAKWHRVRANELRVALRETHLLTIARDAPLLLDGLPGIRDEFRVPPKHGSDQELFDAADRILRNAQRYKKTFVDGKWHADFIDNARAAVDALKAKLNETDTSGNERSRATASIPAAIAKGREVMRSIDRTVVTQLVDDRVSVELWKGAFRVPKRMGRPKKKNTKRRPPPIDTLDA
jgi:multidrug resistance efflux pump